MATQNKVIGSVTDDSKTQVLDLLKQVPTLLPFLISLSIEQKKKLRKAATKRQGYIKDVSDAVKSFPNELPASYNVGEYLGNVELYNQVGDILLPLSVLFSNLDDTHVQLGSQLMKQSDSGYRFLKAGDSNNAQLKTVVEKIGTAFAKQGRKKIVIKPAE